MTEVTRKVEEVRELLRVTRADAVRFKGVDWFSWVTGGADSSLSFGAESGVAEILITMDRTLVLTNSIERERLAVEQIPREFEIVSFPWVQEQAVDDFIASLLASGIVVSDRPQGGEVGLTKDWHGLKLTLSNRELARYQELGADAARAVSAALLEILPNQSEFDLAGMVANKLLASGVQPAMVLVGGESRMMRYRRPLPTSSKIGDRAMVTVSGRRQGLHANLTRHVFFRAPTPEEMERAAIVAEVESEALTATEELRPLPDIYRRVRARFVELGCSAEIERSHFGGPTGYLPREELARSQGSLGVHTSPQMAFAWNPSLPGVRLEDTVFLGVDQRINVLTRDPAWPVLEVAGRKRPAFLIRE